jgi:hypothetical protein
LLATDGAKEPALAAKIVCSYTVVHIVGAALLKWPKCFLAWNPMKIGDSVGNRFIKSNPNFHTKKLTITLLFGGKMTQKVVLPLKCTKAPNVYEILHNGFDSQNSC